MENQTEQKTEQVSKDQTQNTYSPRRGLLKQFMGLFAVSTVPVVTSADNAWNSLLESVEPRDKSKYEVVMDIFKVGNADTLVNDYFKVADKLLNDAQFEKRYENYIRDCAKIYSDFFTYEELLEIRRFHLSAVGRRHSQLIGSPEYRKIVLFNPIHEIEKEKKV